MVRVLDYRSKGRDFEETPTRRMFVSLYDLYRKKIKIIQKKSKKRYTAEIKRKNSVILGNGTYNEKRFHKYLHFCKCHTKTLEDRIGSPVTFSFDTMNIIVSLSCKKFRERYSFF